MKIFWSICSVALFSYQETLVPELVKHDMVSPSSKGLILSGVAHSTPPPKKKKDCYISVLVLGEALVSMSG